MARLASQLMQDCPSTLLVLSASGYVCPHWPLETKLIIGRHGSRVVHHAAAEMDPSLLDSVTAGD